MHHSPSSEESLARLDSLWSHITRKVSSEVARQTQEANDVPLTGAQLFALRVLRRQGPLPMSALADALGVTQSSANGLIERLVETGFVARVRDEEDRRVVRVMLTDSGSERLRRGEERRARALATYFSVLDADELAELVRLFEKVDRGFGGMPEPHSG